MKYRGKFYHEECFICHACRGPLKGNVSKFFSLSTYLVGRKNKELPRKKIL